MNLIRPILALILLASLCWSAGYAVCLALLSRSLWAPRLHLEHRFPPQRFKKINRVVSTVMGLIAATIALYYCAPTTLDSF